MYNATSSYHDVALYKIAFKKISCKVLKGVESKTFNMSYQDRNTLRYR